MKKNVKKEKRVWMNRLLEILAKMSNNDLLEEVINLAPGDDYDGCFTTRRSKGTLSPTRGH